MLNAAFSIVKQAVQNGKHVVTANKKMLAENLEEIYQLQQTYNKSILYEGAVCGSIPILRNLEEYYDNDLITKY
jgi:homoserine dehydrogenase